MNKYKYLKYKSKYMNLLREQRGGNNITIIIDGLINILKKNNISTTILESKKAGLLQRNNNNNLKEVITEFKKIKQLNIGTELMKNLNDFLDYMSVLEKANQELDKFKKEHPNYKKEIDYDDKGYENITNELKDKEGSISLKKQDIEAIKIDILAKLNN